jgi:hypothetical protein
MNEEKYRMSQVLKLAEKQRRHSTAEQKSRDTMKVSKQQQLKKYEDKQVKIQAKKSLAQQAEQTQAKQWRRLLILESQRSEAESMQDKEQHRLRMVKSARDQQRHWSWRERVEAEEQEETDSKIHHYEEKMSVHSSRYRQSVTTLTTRANEKLKRAQEVTVAQEQLRRAEAQQRFIAFLERQAVSQQRRQSLSSQQAQAREIKNNVLRERLMKAKQKTLEQEQLIGKKARTLEAKAEQTNKLIRKRERDNQKQLVLKIEMHKLKTLDSKDLSIREKRVQSARRSKILQRHMEDQHRIETFKQDRQDAAVKKRDLEIKAMIERERVKEALKQLHKSPESVKSRSLVRQFVESDVCSLGS